ncbi:SARP family transcriptional regulator [Rhizocola hellebori]|uniref:SARP family transcriptional regulator n=1 Tax=Rhizocola hellebori TaxID=1392758 RepID=A0A8J3VFF5_9ACTN|nr:AfsR/SARP family transcriptional regulator [Rhizocola hellebori]GIH03838.1 SARP family transcriptional regulator [Rhizocola hellebori]
MLEFRLLGPVEASCLDGAIPLGGTKPRALLAALLLDHDHVVSASRLVDVVWPDNPPESARALVQTYVSSLRKSFARYGFRDLITTRPPGYLLRLRSSDLDTNTFAGLVQQARAAANAGDDDQTAALLREALSLWRGPALSGVESSPLAAEARRLDQLRLAALEERFEAQLRLGRLDHMAELTGLVSRHPANERLRGQLMTTLYRLGRQGDALACYREGRDVLVEELGVEPGPELAALHAAILRGDMPEDSSLPAAQTASPTVVPAQIPPAPADFTGRADPLERLVFDLQRPCPGVHIVAGQGGSGKSALATFAAHRIAKSFPDGLLFAELRGMSDMPATPGEVLGGFLRALGVDPVQVPDSARERTELFRSFVANRRVLVLLDDAADERQVRPLLPGGQGCGVLITSRDRLPGLSGACLIELEMLADGEALGLLSSIAGDDRVAAEPEAAQRILSVCENLPLAIRVVGARLATRRQLPLEVLAGRLTDERQRLDELCAGDLAVRTSIGLSYRALADEAKVALRRMAFISIPDFSPEVVGWLLDGDGAGAERRLELLVDSQLVTFAGPDQLGVLRYRLHDLVRLYAREAAEAEEPIEELHAAVARVVGGWLRVLERIAEHFPPADIVWRQEAVSAPQHESEPVEVSSRILDRASEWMQGEEAAMASGIERAAALGMHELVCEFVASRAAMEMEGANRFDFRARIVGAALEASRRAGDAQAEAGMLAQLAQLRYAQDLYGDARRHFSEALSRFRLIHDVRGQAAALAGLGAACREPGRLAEALHFLDQAATLLQALDDQRGIGYVYRLRGSVRLEQGDFDGTQSDLDISLRAYRAVGSERGAAYTLRTMGLYHRAIGEHAEAMRMCGEAAAIFERLGDELMQSYAVRAQAKAQMRLGDAPGALPRLEWALWAARKVNDRWGQANTLRVLGQLHLAAGRLDLAESCLDAAVSVWDTIDAPLWRARTRHDLCLVYRARGDVAAADETLAEACRVFHDHGAREYKEFCRCIEENLKQPR